MSSHSPWRETREQAVRAMSAAQRAEHRARGRRLLEDLRYQTWRLRVEERFVRAMAAAADDEPVEWQTWPAVPTAQQLADAAAAEYGAAPIRVPQPYDPSMDGTDVYGSTIDITEQLRTITAAAPYYDAAEMLMPWRRW